MGLKEENANLRSQLDQQAAQLASQAASMARQESRIDELLRQVKSLNENMKINLDQRAAGHVRAEVSAIERKAKPALGAGIRPAPAGAPPTQNRGPGATPPGPAPLPTLPGRPTTLDA